MAYWNVPSNNIYEGHYTGSHLAIFPVLPDTATQHKSISILGLEEMLSALHTVLISLRPDLHPNIFVEQSDLLFMYMGDIGLLPMCAHVHTRRGNRC